MKEDNGKAYTFVGQKNVREACRQAARELRAIVEEDLEELSDRDFLSPYVIDATAERLLAANAIVNWAGERNIGMLTQEVNRIIERRGPITENELTGLIRSCGVERAHATTLMVDEPPTFEQQRDLKECLEAAWDEEVHAEPGVRAHVPTLALSRAMQASIGRVEADQVGLMAEELGVELTEAEKEELAQFAARMLWDSGAVRGLVHDQLEAEISNYSEYRGEKSNEQQVRGGIESGLDEGDRADGAQSHGGR